MPAGGSTGGQRPGRRRGERHEDSRNGGLGPRSVLCCSRPAALHVTCAGRRMGGSPAPGTTGTRTLSCLLQTKRKTRAAWTSWGHWTCPFKDGSSVLMTLCAVNQSTACVAFCGLLGTVVLRLSRARGRTVHRHLQHLTWFYSWCTCRKFASERTAATACWEQVPFCVAPEDMPALQPACFWQLRPVPAV